MRMSLRLFTTFAALAATALVPCLVLAADTQTSPASAGNSGGAALPPTAEAIAEARSHYEKGLALYDEQAFDAARIEFERANAIAPNFRVLYNLALVLEQSQDYVAASATFSKYLLEGGVDVPAERVVSTRARIQTLESRIGKLSVRCPTVGAKITVDDVEVGKAPLAEPVRLNPGRRRVGVSMSGRVPKVMAIDIAAGDTRVVELDAEAAQIVTVEKTRRVPYIGWIATGVLAVSGVTFGLLAANANDKREKLQSEPGHTRDELSSANRTTNAYAISADVLAVAALATGAYSLYLTIRWGRETESPKAAKAVFTGNGLAVVGTF
jgi:hypothetical protein